MSCKGKVCGVPKPPPPKYKDKRMTGMQCKRCGKELPIGHRNTCPYCGIRLDTYITPRDTSVKPRGIVNRRNSLMSMISIAFVVFLVVIVVPILQNNTKNSSEAEIIKLYYELKELRPELEAEYLVSKSGNWYEDGDWEIKINALAAMIFKYKEDHPKEEEKHKEYDGYMTELMRPAEITEQGQFNEWAIQHAKDEVLDIISVTVGKPDGEGNIRLSVRLVNHSTDTISQVSAAFEAYGTEGVPVFDETRLGENGDPANLGYIRTNDYLVSGAERLYTFEAVWNNPSVTAAKVYWLSVEYSNGETLFFPHEVCEAIWK